MNHKERAEDDEHVEDILQMRFYLNFVSDNRWKYLTEGLKTTLIITFFCLPYGHCAGISGGNDTIHL